MAVTVARNFYARVTPFYVVQVTLADKELPDFSNFKKKKKTKWLPMGEIDSVL